MKFYMFNSIMLENVDLLFVGIVIAASLILGFVVYFQNLKSYTSKSLLIFTIVSSCWGIVNYLFYKSSNPVITLWLVRLVMFFAVWQAFTFFQLTSVFPSTDKKYPPWLMLYVLPPAIIISALTFTPLIFNGIILSGAEGVPIASQGPALPVFGFFSVGLIIAGISLLVRRVCNTKRAERKPFYFFVTGMVLMFALIICFNFVLPVFFYIERFIPLGAVFIFPFIAFTSYAIIKHKLLDAKIIGTEVLSFILAIATLFEVLLSNNVFSLFLRFSIFLLVLGIGLLLVKSVFNEVKQREELTKLTRSLEKANTRLKELDQQKTDFLSIASHQLRTPLSILKGYIELIKDGGYGKVGNKVLEVLDNMDESNEHLIKLVDEFLDISRIEQGRTKFDFQKKNMAETIDGIVKELAERAEQKGLHIHMEKQVVPEAVYDEEKMRHVVFNFIDNAIKYSESGTIKILANEENNGLAVRVLDHGLGFNKIDEANFFQKFYRGDNVKGTNVTGTGLGLYVCKKFIEAHGGKIWAKSPGLGKGGEFGFWVPLTPTVNRLTSAGNPL